MIVLGYGYEKARHFGLSVGRKLRKRRSILPMGIIGFNYFYLPWQFLYFLPLPQGHGSFLPIFFVLLALFTLSCSSFIFLFSATKSINLIDGILKENTVSPLRFVIEKSPLVMISMPIMIPKFPACSEHSVTRTFSMRTPLGSIIVTK